MAKQLIIWLVLCSIANGANFRIVGVSPVAAARLERVAEDSAQTNSQRFYGKPFPDLHQPIPVTVQAGKGSGLTEFIFDNRRITHCAMTVSGKTLDYIADEVLPHEVMHVVNAAHFRRSLPRWFDEGISSLAEKSEEAKSYERLRWLREEGRIIPFVDLMLRMDYHHDTKAAYAQSCSMVAFLNNHDAGIRLPIFVQDASKNTWDRALTRHYGYKNIEEFEAAWKDWLQHGAPHVAARDCRILRWLSGRWRRCHMGHPRYPQVQIGGTGQT